MGGVDVGGGGKGKRKSLDSEINMIPMIDLLMVTISFLLI
ncbi:MAG: biopolymer transporter, partial [Myxococcota bacterium]|nr:biopolymer transporter [Myxococcota bacterium]